VNELGLRLLELAIERVVLPAVQVIVSTYERVRRGWLCLRHGHDYRPLTQSGRRCSRCPAWED
jgi:hypothetical protein